MLLMRTWMLLLPLLWLLVLHTLHCNCSVVMWRSLLMCAGLRRLGWLLSNGRHTRGCCTLKVACACLHGLCSIQWLTRR